MGRVARPARLCLVLTYGADRLSRCAEIIYTAIPRSLKLHCAFDIP